MIPRILFFYLCFVYSCTGYKVLVYNAKFSFSHMSFLGSLADTLAKAGNEVIVLQPIINPAIKGSGSKYAKVIEIDLGDSSNSSLGQLPELRRHLWDVVIRNPFNSMNKGEQAAKGFAKTMRGVLNKKDLMEQLKAEKFDIAICEMFDYGGFPIFYELGIKTLVGTHSTVFTDRTAWAIGAPISPSSVPAMQSAAGDDGSFLSRLLNLAFTYTSWEFEIRLESAAQDYMDEFHPEAPKISEMIANLAYIFTNSEPFVDFPRSTPYKVVDIGGIGYRESKPLTEEWKKLLSERKRNVLISFGSLVPSMYMPDEYKKNIEELAKRFPDVTFIFKYENPEDGAIAKADNLHLSKWMPQTDLLASGKIDLFVTHGGAGSVMETASSGVPAVVIPVFGDQYRNSLTAERSGFALLFDKFDLGNAEKLSKAVKFGLENKEMRNAARKMKELLASRPFTPQEKFLKHMDHAVKFGNIPTLNSNARNFTFVQSHNLDIFAALILIFALVLFLIFSVVRFLYKCVFQRKSKVE